MSESPVSVLVFSEDRDLAERLRDCTSARGFRLICVSTVPALVSAVSGQALDVCVLGFTRATNVVTALVRDLKSAAPETRIVFVFVEPAGDAEAITLDPFADVVQPFDARTVLAMIGRALGPRQTELQNWRLLWELKVINEIGEVISRSLELDDVLTGALQRVVNALDAVGGAIRLRDSVTARYDVKAYVGPSDLRLLWQCERPSVPRPSDPVIARRMAVVVEDVAEFAPQRVAALPVRSTICVPMFGKDELIGTLSVAAERPFRFDVADEHLLTIIAGQIAVAVQNTWLHETVRRGKREWEQTFDAISDPIAVFDSHGLLLRSNTALATLLGKPVTQLRHQTCHEIGFCGGPCPQCAVGQALNRGSASRAEITRPNGNIFSVTTFPVASGAKGASVVQVAKNVTEEIRSARRLRQMSEEVGVANARLTATLEQLKSTQAQLLQADKIAAIGQLVAGVAHELNNPLTSVIGYAQLLQEEFLDNSGQESPRPAHQIAEDLRRIADESERAARIVRNLLAFARRQAAERTPQDVTELINRILSLRAYELKINGIELQTEFGPGLPQVNVDGSQIQQALLNLILNAEQAMRGRAARKLRVSARFDEATAAVELSVTDTGHGIDHANVTRIFDPFFTTREVGEGTGLGLSICYGIVRDHGGQISVDSKVQVGTTFSILLPARVEKGTERGDEILVAHAGQGERDFIAAALDGWGFRVVARAAEEALPRYRRGGLQAALIDRAVLAGDLAGWSAARAANRRPVPLILMSMTADESEIERFGREQASAILRPPFQLGTLRRAVRAVAREYA